MIARWAGRALIAALGCMFALNLVWIARSWKPLTTIAVPRGLPAPEFDLPMLDGGGRARVADGRGHAMVIDFWATWCAPCRAELPALDRLRARYQDVRFLAVNTEGEDARELVAAFVRSTGLRLPVALDSGAVSQQYHVDTIPMLVILDGAGRVASVLHGNHAESEIAAAIDRARAAPN